MKKHAVLLTIAFSLLLAFFLIKPSCEPNVIQVTRTVTATVYASPSFALNSVVVETGKSFYSTVVDDTTYVTIPKSYSFVGNVVYSLLEIDNPGYLALVASSAAEYGLLPPKTFSDFFGWGVFATRVATYFDYNTMRLFSFMSGKVSPSYLPNELITVRSGICGDFALFYAALLLERGYTITFLALDFGGYGHAAVDVSGMVLENNTVGEWSGVFFDKWLNYYGNTFLLYYIIIDSSGIISIGTSTIDHYFVTMPSVWSASISYGPTRILGYFSRKGTSMVVSVTTYWDSKSTIVVMSYSSGVFVSNGEIRQENVRAAAYTMLKEAQYPVSMMIVTSSTTIELVNCVYCFEVLTYYNGSISGALYDGVLNTVTGTYVVT